MELRLTDKRRIILVEKQNSSDDCWAYLLRMNKVPGFTVEQVLKKYQGFEGKDKAYYQVYENDPEFNEKIDLFYESLYSKNDLFLYVSSTEDVYTMKLKNRHVG